MSHDTQPITGQPSQRLHLEHEQLISGFVRLESETSGHKELSTQVLAILLPHTETEEGILLPVLDGVANFAKTGSRSSLKDYAAHEFRLSLILEGLSLDHAKLKALALTITGQVQSDVRSDMVVLANRLIDHMAFEDELFYPVCKAFTSYALKVERGHGLWRNP